MQKLQRAEAAETEIVAYFTTLVAQRRAYPRGDLLSDLIAVEEAGETLSEAEVIAVASLLFGSGLETTTNLIGNGMGALLTQPLRVPAAVGRSGADPLRR